MNDIFNNIQKIKNATKEEADRMVEKEPCLAPFHPDYDKLASAILLKYNKGLHAS